VPISPSFPRLLLATRELLPASHHLYNPLLLLLLLLPLPPQQQSSLVAFSFDYNNFLRLSSLLLLLSPIHATNLHHLPGADHHQARSVYHHHHHCKFLTSPSLLLSLRSSGSDSQVIQQHDTWLLLILCRLSPTLLSSPSLLNNITSHQRLSPRFSMFFSSYYICYSTHIFGSWCHIEAAVLSFRIATDTQHRLSSHPLQA